MVNRKKRNFFLTLSKKELQMLCKKYGLPTYKTKPDLAESLSSLLPENVELKGLKDKFGYASCPNSIEHVSNSASSGKNYMYIKEVGTSKVSAETARIESVRCVEVRNPTFEFHARSEGGIKLYVDLNSTITEWADSLKKNICIPESNVCLNSPWLHEDLGQLDKSSSHLKASSPTTVGNINFEHLLSGTAPNSANKENSCKDIVSSGRSDVFLTPSVGVFPMTDVEFSRHVSENGALVLPKSGSCTPSQTPVSASIYEPKLDYTADPVTNSLSDDAINFLTTEQPMKVITKQCGNSQARYDYGHPNLGSVMNGFSTTASSEKHLSEVADLQKDKASPYGIDENGVVLDHGESVNLSQLDFQTKRNHFLCSENQERSSIANGMENSELSHFKKPCDRNTMIADDFESNGSFPNRQSTNDVAGYCFSNPEAGNFRRSSHLTGETLPRRSMQLVSKVLSIANLLAMACICMVFILTHKWRTSFDVHPTVSFKVILTHTKIYQGSKMED
ncbi:hypothetical protein SAY87_003713 [Trapa incisa]|uniref:SAP domain-containing protein n=1 Tax=Trapa incisa TaxID=236973 RepID=A0AAN7QI19_9MYRT|nr:hypothetical protein SAY87_003713 [Trapa incisa]